MSSNREPANQKPNHRAPNGQDVDILIKAKWIIPVIPEDQIFEDCAIAIKDEKILAIVPQAEAAKRFTAKETVELTEHIVIPGLINAHGHLAMSLLRGYADDLPLQAWLENHIWPAEGRWVDEQFVHDGSQLAMAEMLRSGTTCFADMYFYPDQVAMAAQQAGMRAQITAPILDFPTMWAQNAEEYLRKAIDVHDQFRTSDLVTIGFGPHAPYTVSDEPLKQIAVYAEELQAPIQIHLHETQQEVTAAVAATGMRPIARLQKLDFLSPLVQCIHMTALNADDIEMIQASGASVVHCPESNLKLASGFCPIPQLQHAGINVALGTDGCASNNDLDLFGEMRTAALITKGYSSDASQLSAHQALRLATINGARAMGLEALIGSLEVGKAADITAIKIDHIEALPMYNPCSYLVYNNAGRDVSDVWVKGRRLLKSRQLMTLNQAEIQQRTREWQRRIQQDA